MPVKGSKLKYGNRDFIFDTTIWKELVKEHDIKSTFTQCNKIINTCNANIAEVIREDNDGFKLPLGLGYLCVSRFIPKKPAIDWAATHANNGKHLHFNNFGTFGYSVAVKWFRVGRITNAKINEIFKFHSCKKMAGQISKRFLGGKAYSEVTVSDFIEKSRLENLYNKKYRKDLKD